MKSNQLFLLSLTALSLGVLASACGNKDAEEESAEERATRSVVIGSDQPPARTEDGYDVIFANPSAMHGPRPSRPGEGRAARERENLIREPNAPDPNHGSFTLEEAVEGMPIDGQLVAEINTDLGTLFCDLHADRVPNTVANFIGLARGRRSWWDARAGQWVLRPAYTNTKFHRVIPGYMIQGGDYLGDGSGTVGYTIPDESHPSLTSHDKAGQLCMANTGPNENGAQFFITDGAAPQLDGSYTIFGQCRPEDVITRIARVPQDADQDNRPLTDVVIERVLIRRVDGGAAVATRSPPQLPEGYDPNTPERGASTPGELERRMEERRQQLQEQIRQRGAQQMQ